MWRLIGYCGWQIGLKEVFLKVQRWFIASCWLPLFLQRGGWMVMGYDQWYLFDEDLLGIPLAAGALQRHDQEDEGAFHGWGMEMMEWFQEWSKANWILGGGFKYCLGVTAPTGCVRQDRWFQIFLVFNPTWWNDPIWLAHIFQMGWFNHQLEIESAIPHGSKKSPFERTWTWRDPDKNLSE